ncbi:MAG: glycosyltransferase family 39 protein [Betaproteobacteria bacterium]|nr:MAG: glycosyltransferase family 39 protein [Betaproteobacteria bacterium]
MARSLARIGAMGACPSVLTANYRTPAALALLIAVWLAAGLFGRDPWKPDEAYSFGLVLHILHSGDWVVPTLAGEPFMEKPPLFFISAALFARLFGGFLPLHDAARLASGFYAALTLAFVWLSARTLYGRSQALAALLVLMGCVGYFHTAHLLVTVNALMAGIALAIYGLALHPQRPTLGGIALGTGAGVAFMAKGLIGPGMLGLTTLALAASPAWRTRGYARALGIAALAFAPWAMLWPWALYQRSPELFHEWLFVNNFGRYTGSADLGPEHDHWMYLKILPWFALPALPLAAWSGWRGLRERDPRIVLPLVASAVRLAVLSSACNARYVYALPVLVPLSLAAGAGCPAMPRWLARGLLWLGLALGFGAALALWAGWAALLAHRPAPLADGLLAMRPGFTPGLQPFLVLLAALATLGALLAVGRVRRAQHAAPLAWAASAALAWTLFFTIWLPYQNYGNSYRALVTDLRAHLPNGAYCIANRQLGEPQRAMLEYFGGILTLAESAPGARYCAFLLVQQGYGDELPRHGPQWTPLWSGTRSGDATERFWLFSAQPVLDAQVQKVDVQQP